MKEERISDRLWIVIGIIALVTAITIIAVTLYAGYRPPSYGSYYGMMGSYWGGYSIVMWIGGIVLMVIVIYILYEIFRPSTVIHHPGERNAEELLKIRLVNGEISVDEFEEKMAAFRKTGDEGRP